MTIEQKIDEFIKNETESSLIWSLDDIKGEFSKIVWKEEDNENNQRDPSWKEKQLIKWKELYLKEKRSIIDEINFQKLWLILSILCKKDIQEFKKELDDLKNWIQKEQNVEIKEDKKETEDIDSTLETSDIWNKIVALAQENVWISNIRELIKNPKDVHCWGWVDAIYSKAGLTRWSNKRKVIYQNWKHYSAIWDQKLTNKDLMNEIKPWDWLYVHNKNWVDKNWDHSIIFLWWENWIVGKARIANYRWTWDIAEEIKSYDLNKNHIRHITRPLAA